MLFRKIRPQKLSPLAQNRARRNRSITPNEVNSSVTLDWQNFHL
jgi:hypothetical protein